MVSLCSGMTMKTHLNIWQWSRHASQSRAQCSGDSATHMEFPGHLVWSHAKRYVFVDWGRDSVRSWTTNRPRNCIHFPWTYRNGGAVLNARSPRSHAFEGYCVCWAQYERGPFMGPSWRHFILRRYNAGVFRVSSRDVVGYTGWITSTLHWERMDGRYSEIKYWVTSLMNPISAPPPLTIFSSKSRP